MSEYPQADIVDENREQSQAIGEFLDWLSEQGVVLCRWKDKAYYNMDGEQISREEALAMKRPPDMEYFETPYEIGQQGFVPAREDTFAWLALFFGIDLEKYHAEQEQILKELQES